MNSTSPPPEQRHVLATGKSQFWLGLLGGALAWTVHLMASYLISEFGCASALATYSLLDINSVVWILLALTLLTFLVALAAGLLAYRNLPSRDEEADTTARGARAYAARAGLMADAAFACVILVESVPILYYLQACH